MRRCDCNVLVVRVGVRVVMTLREGDAALAMVTRKPKCRSLDQALNRILKDLLSARLIDSQCLLRSGCGGHVVWKDTNRGRRRLKFVAASNGRLHEGRARQSESDRAVLA